VVLDGAVSATRRDGVKPHGVFDIREQANRVRISTITESRHEDDYEPKGGHSAATM